MERIGHATLAIAIVACLPAWETWAQSTSAANARATFDIPAGSLTAALDRFSTQAGIQTLSEPDQLAGKQAGAVSGEMSWREALDRLLRGSGLEYRQVNATTVVIRPADPRPKKSGAAPVVTSSSGKASDAAASIKDMQTVTVTGTRIRGGTTPSPVITIGAEDIQQEGFTDLGEVARSIPQNFSGGQNPGVINGTASTYANQNLTGGSSLNLRGLGPDATLTLLNGRRLSYSGPYQAVDISAIPVEAVDRIEIVPDGASAIYGSDAVGGVGNVILKRDYQGITVGARYGGATEGGLGTREYNTTAGTTWSTGGMIATWQKTSSEPISADQRDYTRNMYEPATIYADTDLRSGLFSGHQALGEFVDLRLDALRTARDLGKYFGYSDYYIFTGRKTTTSLVSPSIEFALPGDWTLTAGATWGKDDAVERSDTVDTTGVSTDRALYGNKSRVYEVGAEGALFALRGGDARLAAGIGYRRNEFQDRDLTSGIANADHGDSSRFAYAELSLPFISPDSHIAGAHRLELSAALRGEDYNSFGRVTTPKIGLIYGPSADFTLKASWGKSFKAPTLLQRYGTYYTYLYPAAALGGVGYPSGATVLAPFGGNPDLKAERARTWSASVAFHPEAIPDLQTELTWFDINYTDRVVLPITNGTETLSDPVYAEFISYYPTAEEQANAIANSKFRNFSGADYDPGNVVAIASNRYINATRQQIEGLDLSGSYRLDLGSGRLLARGSAAWLQSTQRTTAAQGSSYALAGTLFNPAKFNSRLGLVWSQGGFSASSFVNYTGGVRNTLDREKTASFTTLDTTLRYDTGKRDDVLSDLVFELSVQNLFNRVPPLYTPSTPDAARYDSTNYSAIGRFMSISVSKHF